MMNKLMNKLNEQSIKAYLAAQNFVNSEDGDTNFVSIMLILGIVIGVAVVFSTLSSTVSGRIQGIVTNFLNTLG